MRNSSRFLPIVLLTLPFFSLAQSVGISGSAITPDAQSILEIQSTSKGVLLPRMTTAQRTAVAPTNGSDHGLMVYDTDTKTYWYWDGSSNAWREIPNTSGIVTTLDGAYDGGGSGVGRTITADAGAVNIASSGGLTVNGNVGIGNTSPQQQLSVGSSTSDAQAVTIRGYSNTPTSWKGGGAFGYTSATVILGELNGVAQLGGHSSTLNAWADLAINAGNANVGIGTTTPGQKLDVAGDVRIETGYLNIWSYNSTEGGQINLADGGNNADGQTSAWSLDVYNDDLRIMDDGTPRIFVDQTGNVGIGTTTPDALLNVGSATGANVFLTREDATTTVGDALGSILFDSTDDTGPSTTDASAGIRAFAAEDHGNSNKGGNLTFFTKPTGTSLSNAAIERLRIMHNGKVGIGTTAPQHQLNVGSTTSDGQTVTVRGYSNDPGSWKGGGAFGYSSATVIMGELSGVAQIGGHNGTLGAWADLAINSGGGNVGIGTSSPGSKLDVSGTITAGSGAGKISMSNDNVNGNITNNTGNFLFYTPVSTNYIWHVNGSQKMVLDANGNLGVGTTTPYGRTHIITTDSDGSVASWGTGQLVVGLAAPNGSSSGGVGISYSASNNTGYISSLSPTTSWRNLGIRVNDLRVYVSGATERLTIEAGGNYRLALQSDNNLVYYTSTNCAVWASGTSCSDIRKKDRIVPLESVLPTIMQLSTIRFHYKEGLGLDEDEHIGVIAQEIEKHYPDMVYYDKVQDSYVVYYDKLTTVLIKGMQEQQKQIEALQADNETMKGHLSNYASLVSEIDAIKAAIGLDSQTSK
ncbi:MAG: hypothetical protein GC178_14995 [Flavobacteriales bacterium]|nr:hypothetical protein [Flavobacteriales bacterium]